MATDSALPKLEPDRLILTHLNADTSWLISFPRPPTKDVEHKVNKRSYFHVIVDPWLDTEYVFFSRWFIAVSHATPSKYKTIEQVQRLILDIECAAENANLDPEDKGHPDAVFVSHHLGDHCDRATLEQIDPLVPFISIASVVEHVKKWNHFQMVESMPDLDIDAPQSLWQTYESAILPDYLRVGRLPDGGPYPELHWATLLAFSPSQLSSSNAQVETILYSPHGIHAHRLIDTNWATKYSKPLLLLHGLNPAWSPQQANLGVDNASKLATILKPKYWIPTHDGELKYRGFLSWFQQKTKKTFADANLDIEDWGEQDVKPICRELGNGEVFVLA
ncbi:hypothetical protein Vi05172_g3479 [Venturia inaequalis]|nr:hypothetical protein Vi05172_g3479 [Venturia inaequalis]